MCYIYTHMQVFSLHFLFIHLQEQTCVCRYKLLDGQINCCPHILINVGNHVLLHRWYPHFVTSLEVHSHTHTLAIIVQWNYNTIVLLLGLRVCVCSYVFRCVWSLLMSKGSQSYSTHVLLYNYILCDCTE